MSTELLHGRMSFVDENGNATILHQETSASDVLVNIDNNKNGLNGNSAIPSDVNTLQKLTDKIGDLAFKSKVESSDLDNNIIINNYNTTEEGRVLDARRGKDLNDRITSIEESEYVYIEDSEDNEVVLPESEINDNIVSETLTWSSDKINELIQQILDDTHTFYVPLVENVSGNYIAQKSVTEIEEAYQTNHPIWVMASEVLLPLRQRVDANNWIFSGYADGRAYDIQISNTGVTITYNPVATLNDTLPNPNVLKLTGAVNAIYDGSTEIEVEIPEVIDDNSTSESNTWSSNKITEFVLQNQGDGDINLSGYVPTTRKVNNKELSTDIALTASDVGAATSGHTHADIYADKSHAHKTLRITGAVNAVYDGSTEIEVEIPEVINDNSTSESNTWSSNKITEFVLQNQGDGDINLSGYVPTSRKVNNKALSTDIALTASDVGAAEEGHTHNYAGSSSAGGAATSANKVNKTLTVKLNGGSTEGTNLYTFDGSTAKSINITPNSIGAATSGHGHDNDYAKVNHSHDNYVPTTRKVNNKELSTDVTLSASDVGAAEEGHEHSNYVPTTRKVNNKALSVDISLTASDVGAAEEGHTHNYAGSSSAGGAATSANKVNKSLLVKLNGGSTEGTNLYTFDGSTEKSIDITPDSIGAATSGHGHDNYVPTTRKVNNKALSANITLSASDVGAAEKEHTHNYAGSSSAGGAATSANKVNKSLTVKLNNGTTEGDDSYTFDGSVTKEINITPSSIGAAEEGHTHDDDYIVRNNPVATGSFACGSGGTSAVDGNNALAVGTGAVSSGICSAAIGSNVTASGNYSAAFGVRTTSKNNQFVIGHYNADTDPGSLSGTNGTAFVIGNGTSNDASNAFTVGYDGDVNTLGAVNAVSGVDTNGNVTAVGYVTCKAVVTAGGDYAEYFEWVDRNPENEDRRGYFVTLDGMKIKKANPDDYILGIISGHPSIIGNGDNGWKHRYMVDEFGSYIYEEIEYEEEELDEETGETKIVIKTRKVRKENPEYDPTKEYIQRADRPEWAVVGMLGVLSVRDDGTCEVNGYCQVAENGTATKSDTGYRVISRVTENVVKVIFK